MGRLTRMASTRSRIDFDPREEPIDKSKLVSTDCSIFTLPTLSQFVVFLVFFRQHSALFGKYTLGNSIVSTVYEESLLRLRQI